MAKQQSRRHGAGASAGDEAQEGGVPVVGVGASAGGLEALELLFRGISPNSGMAYVVVQHLDPGHESMLTEILQRATALPVQQAEDQMAVEPDRVYVIPPNRQMAIFQRKLQLSPLERPPAQHMRIDGFFRSLADDLGTHAVGIILSGTGTDGTLGLRAILGAGGVSLVQDPATAKYDGMPLSAIRAGFATRVLPPDQMPSALLDGARTLASHREGEPAPPAAAGLARVLMALRSETGQDFSKYKKSTVARRIERRMSQYHIDDLAIYARFLQENPAEVRALFKELLINVTSFFRDPEAFAALKREALPQLLAGRPAHSVFRVWVAGCATGEEAYSIAILLREWMDECGVPLKVQIYSTDLDAEAIALARGGMYPPNIVQDVEAERLGRYFIKEETGYRVSREIREMVVFAIHNLTRDPPFTRLDLLSCRNLLIYLEPELQERLIPSFHYALNPGGVLFLSPSESIGNHTELFAAIERRWKLYRSIPAELPGRATERPARPVTLPTPGAAPARPQSGEIAYAEATRRALLLAYAPASVLTDEQGSLLYVHGETAPFLRPAPGHATLNVVEMARRELKHPLRTAIAGATEGTPTLKQEIPLQSEDGGPTALRLSVRPLPGAGGNGRLLLVSFEEVARPVPAPRTRAGRVTARQLPRIEALERELASTRENLQVTIEMQQVSAEEMQSTNEELQSTNEELQATNEELETSKEELQSVNEELTTLNAELQSKIELLTLMQNDMKNLMDNINVGAIFLDPKLVIRRFTREASRVYRLLASDVGRPLADIKSELLEEDLLNGARRVLEELTPYEQELRTPEGAWFLSRIQPYRTLDNLIDGVVLTFTDITTRVEAEERVRDARHFAEAVVDTVREPLLVLDDSLRVVSASGAFYRYFHVSPQETIGQPLYRMQGGAWDIPALRELLDRVLPQDRSFEGYVVEHEFPSLGRRRLLLNARRVLGSGGLTRLILLAFEEPA